jgi:hypothetical protein
MAAATVTSSQQTRMGRKRVVFGLLTAPANNDTWVTGLASIDHVNIGFPAGNLAAADAVSYTLSGGTITFKVIGTARDLAVQVIGL